MGWDLTYEIGSSEKDTFFFTCRESNSILKSFWTKTRDQNKIKNKQQTTRKAKNEPSQNKRRSAAVLMRKQACLGRAGFKGRASAKGRAGFKGRAGKGHPGKGRKGSLRGGSVFF